MLSDRAFLTSYVPENRRRLKKSFEILKSGLEALSLRVIPAVGAIFAFVDFRAHMSAPTWEAEADLRVLLLKECGVIFSPGWACHAPVPGYFRVCYAWVEPEVLQVAIDRLAQFLQRKR